MRDWTHWFSSAPSTYKCWWRNFGPFSWASANNYLTFLWSASRLSGLWATFSCRENGFSLPAESSGAPAESSGYTLKCRGDLSCGHFRGCRDEAEKPKISLVCHYGPVDRLTYRSRPVTLNGHWGVIFQWIFKPNISLERSCSDLDEYVLFLWIRPETAERRLFFRRGEKLFFPDTIENYARLNKATVCSPGSETKGREFPTMKIYRDYVPFAIAKVAHVHLKPTSLFGIHVAGGRG